MKRHYCCKKKVKLFPSSNSSFKLLLVLLPLLLVLLVLPLLLLVLALLLFLPGLSSQLFKYNPSTKKLYKTNGSGASDTSGKTRPAPFDTAAKRQEQHARGNRTYCMSQLSLSDSQKNVRNKLNTVLSCFRFKTKYYCFANTVVPPRAMWPMQ